MRRNPDNDARRRISEGTSKGMRRSAEKRRCPKCGRKGALKRRDEPGQFLLTCRYCDFEKLTWKV